MTYGLRPWSFAPCTISRRRRPRTLALDPIFPSQTFDRPSLAGPLHRPAVAPIQAGMITRLQDREAVVARITPEDWRDVARRLAILALLVVGITAHAVQFYLSLRQFESGPPVAPTTYVARFTEITSAEGRPYRDFPVEYPPVSLAAIEVAARPNGNQTGAPLVWVILIFDLATVAGLSFGWGPRTAVAYLFLTAPLLGFLYTTIDLRSEERRVGKECRS